MSSSLRFVLLLSLPLLSAALTPSRDAESAFDTSVTNDWEEILRELPSDSLEAALGHHLTPKYREGVFEDGHSAMDAVHSDDPELASKLVDLAKQDAEVKDYLRKRQNNSTGEITTTITIPPTSITSLSATTTTTQGESTPGGGSDTTPASTSSGQSSSASEVSSTSVPSTSSTSPPVGSTSTPDDSAIPSSSVVESSSVISQDGQTTTIFTSITLPASTPTSAGETPSTADSSSPSPSSVVPSSSSQEQGSPSSSVSSSNASPTSEISSSTSPPPSSLPSSSDDSLVPTGLTQTGVLVPVEVTTTTDGSAIVSSSNAFETSAPTSVAVEVTSTNDQGQVVVTTSNAPAAIMTFTNAQGDVQTTAVPLTSVAVAPGGGIVDGPTVTSMDASGNAYVLTSPTPGGVYTVTDARGLVVTVTYQPHRSTVNQVQLLTTTLPNGMRATITSFAVVGAPTSGAEPAASPSGDEPNLQSGAAIPSSWYAAEIALVLGAAIGVAGIVL